MSTALAPYEAPLAIQHSQEDYDALKASVCKDLTDAEFRVFVAGALARGLDPFTNQIYVYKKGTDKPVTMIGIDGARAQAESTGLYRGRVGPFWCGEDGVWTRKWLSDKAPVAAKVGVKRAGFDEITWGFARFKSFNKGRDLWVQMPEVMIAKCAEMAALRAAFPKVLGGVYIPEEMRGVDLNDMETVITEDTTAERSSTQASSSTKAPAAKNTVKDQRSVSEEWQYCYDLSKAMGLVKSWADWDAVQRKYTTPAAMLEGLKAKINTSSALRQRYRAWAASHPEPTTIVSVTVAAVDEAEDVTTPVEPADIAEAFGGHPEDVEGQVKEVPAAADPEPAPASTELAGWPNLDARQRRAVQTLAAQAQMQQVRLNKIVAEFNGDYDSIVTTIKADIVGKGRQPVKVGA